MAIRTSDQSNIPEARRVLEQAAGFIDCPPRVAEKIKYAISLMIRAPRLRKAATKSHHGVSPEQRVRIEQLLATTDMAYGPIAVEVGLGPTATGRISEIAHKARLRHPITHGRLTKTIKLIPMGS